MTASMLLKKLRHWKNWIGIITYDRHDNTYNKNGVYGITAKLNGIQIKGLQFSKIRFSDSEYLPTLIDYERYSRTRQRVQKLFGHLQMSWNFSIMLMMDI
ncbi:MAG: hypothetical protein CM15mP83_9510 [Flavobacteriaceae bacterium]|nr:MAG: hypothetical protein CM15mP83_9510 [Flavobacteriaceae bacterium]